MTVFYKDEHRQHLEYADALDGTPAPIEGYSMYKHGTFANNNVPVKINDTVQSMFKVISEEARLILPYAAERYNISSDLRDYVFVPVAVMFNDLPNRNGVGFPLSQLTLFNPEHGKLAYQTWKHKPTFVEHANQDYTVAKGMIMDVALRRDTRFAGKVYKVYHLLGFDRQRDKVLANSILDKSRTAYSMGAWVHDYRCSICNSSVNDGGCDHVQVGKPQMMKRYPNGDLAYLMAQDPVGFECSSVGIPAFGPAYNPDILSV